MNYHRKVVMKSSSLIGIATIALMSGLLPTNAISQTKPQSEWIWIGENSDGTKSYSGKKGSYELSSTKAGTPIALILGQIEDKKTKTVSYGKWYVATADCESGLGKLVVLKVNGDYDFETDYVGKGNNVASGIGDAICGIYLSNKRGQEGKGV